jgi:serine protease Do
MKKMFLSLTAIGTAFVIGASTSDFFTSEADAQTALKMNLGDPLPANLFVELAKAVNPTVVNISTSYMPQRQRRGDPRGMPADPMQELFEEFLRRQGGGGAPVQQQPQQSLGTGFIIRKDGLILTNNHVINQATTIQVQLSESDKTLYTAKIIGQDERTDTALIKIDIKKDLPVAKLGSSKDLQVGEWVAAFGNPFGHGHTMTKGIVSATERRIDEINRFPFIQTDASINPGNSGGPLVNTRGEVIGVNTAIDQRAQGIGFAIAIDEIKKILPALEKDGTIQRGFLGVQMASGELDPRARRELKLPDGANGAFVMGVIPGSPAAKAGIREYDLIVKFNGVDVGSSDELRRAVENADVNATYNIEYFREGKRVSSRITLAGNDIGNASLAARVQKAAPPAGTEVPHGFGFKVANHSPALAEAFGLPVLQKPAPIIIEVKPGAPAARAQLRVGDVVLDVNRTTVSTDKDVVKAMKAKQVNSLRVLRGTLPILFYLEP